MLLCGNFESNLSFVLIFHVCSSGGKFASKIRILFVVNFRRSSALVFAHGVGDSICSIVSTGGWVVRKEACASRSLISSLVVSNDSCDGRFFWLE